MDAPRFAEHRGRLPDDVAAVVCRVGSVGERLLVRLAALDPARPTLRVSQTARLTAFLVLWDGTVMPILSITGEVGVENPIKGSGDGVSAAKTRMSDGLAAERPDHSAARCAVAGRRGGPRHRVAPDVRLHQRQPVRPERLQGRAQLQPAPGPRGQGLDRRRRRPRPQAIGRLEPMVERLPRSHA